MDYTVRGRGRDRTVTNPSGCELAGLAMVREPGELSSDGSDSGLGPETQNSGKKRKFSPIVWDRDDLRSPRDIRVETNRNSPANGSDVRGLDWEVSPSRADMVPDEVDVSSPVRSSSDQVAEGLVIDEEGREYGPVQTIMPSRWENNVEDLVDDGGRDHMPLQTIASSRWANNEDSPADEGEIYEEEDFFRMRNSGLSECRRKSSSPEFGEGRRGGSGGTRGRLSGSLERRGSSSKYVDSYADDVDRVHYMEDEEDRLYDGSSDEQIGSESEDDSGSSGGTPGPAFPPQRSVNMLQGCRSVDEFEQLNKINEGTYGVVYRARDKKTGEIVALKKVKMEREREGFPLTSIREINILLSFNHPSIVDVKEVVVSSKLDKIFLVMEYMEHDLKGLMESMKQPFSQSEVKCLMLQLLGGIKYLHDNWVLHRDLKTSNLLLNNSGELKICDFGMARQYGSPLKPYTHLVVTLWYRAPELLLGAKQYSTAIDMWSLGCIMAELLSKEPLFNGKTEFDQLDKIFRILGTPNETIWPGFSKLPGVKINFVKHQYNLLRRKFPATSFTGSPVLSDAGFDLLNKLLTYDPEKRITAEAALNHQWFREVPLPKSKEFMPTFPAQHVQDRRMRRVMKSPDPLEEQRRKELQQGELGTGGLFGH